MIQHIFCVSRVIWDIVIPNVAGNRGATRAHCSHRHAPSRPLSFSFAPLVPGRSLERSLELLELSEPFFPLAAKSFSRCCGALGGPLNAFVACAGVGALGVARHAVSGHQYPSLPASTGALRDSLAFSCANGHADFARWVLSLLPGGAASDCRPITWNDAMVAACSGGHLPCAVMVADDALCRFGSDVCREGAAEALSSCCKCGNDLAVLECSKWIVGRFGITRDEIIARQVGADALSHARVEVAAWLEEKFSIVGSLTRTQIGTVLSTCVASENGLEGAKWINEHLELKAMDAFVCDFFVLRTCLRYGGLETAKWLCVRFPSLRLQYIRHPSTKVIRWVCGGGMLETVKWFCEEFQIAEECVRMARALEKSCSHGHLGCAQFLVNRYNLTSEDAIADQSAALRKACMHGHFTCAKWLAEHFSITSDDAAQFYYEAFREACGHGYLDIAQWLHLKFFSGTQWVDQIVTNLCTCLCFVEDAECAMRLEIDRYSPSVCIGVPLIRACKEGHLNTLQWLWDTFLSVCEQSTKCLLSKVYPHLLVASCLGNQIECLEWTIQALHSLQSPVDYRLLLSSCCTGGSLACLQHIHTIMYPSCNQLPPTDLVMGCIFRAGRTKNIFLVQWLRDTFSDVIEEDLIADTLLEQIAASKKGTT